MSFTSIRFDPHHFFLFQVRATRSPLEYSRYRSDPAAVRKFHYIQRERVSLSNLRSLSILDDLIKKRKGQHTHRARNWIQSKIF